MKRPSKNSQLDEMVRAARGDVPPASFVEEMRTLGLLSSGADGLGSMPGAESSLAPGAGAPGSGLLGGGVAKLVVGGITSAVLAGGLWVSVQQGVGSSSLPGVRESRESAAREVLPLRGEEPRALAVPSSAPLGQGTGEGAEDADGNATLPLPPVFEPERREGSVGKVSRVAAVQKQVTRAEARDGVTRSEQVLAEAGLVDRARRALRTDAAHALSLTEQCAREFPSGAAATERSVIAIEALVRLGREAEARARLASFERAHPTSFHLPYLRRLLPKGAESP